MIANEHAKTNLSFISGMATESSDVWVICGRLGSCSSASENSVELNKSLDPGSLCGLPGVNGNVVSVGSDGIFGDDGVVLHDL